MIFDNKLCKETSNLAMLKLQESEIESFSKDLTNIINMIDYIKSQDSNNIEPLLNPLEQFQPLRDDKVTEDNQSHIFLKQSASHEANLFLVPKVI